MKSRSAGFTLVELLVVLGILTLITGTLLLILNQIFDIPRWGNAQLAVDSDLRNAALWLVRDANESQAFTGTAGSCVPFTFTHGSEQYGYTLNGETLERRAGITTTNNIARHVSEINCPSGTVTGTVAVTLHATAGEVSGSATYTLTMRQY
ncbi:MAG TPA: prepilin-type N-terminal cleavage/methylation domain-containing protein [Thermoflexia bacterium]|nr:prepilin-type N-terminal cleavage/methylation domain-containing protein [Thermoflexia bacterium]